MWPFSLSTMKRTLSQATSTAVERFDFDYTDLIYLQKTTVTTESAIDVSYRIIVDETKISRCKYIAANGEDEIMSLWPVLAKRYENNKYVDALDEKANTEPMTSDSLDVYWQGVTPVTTILETTEDFATECALKEVEDETIFNNYNLYFFSHCSHSIYDINGDPIPQLKTYDYIGSIFESDYRRILEAMQERIKTHSWCRYPEKIKIVDVPYYNNDSGNRKTFEGLHLVPSREEYKEIYDNLIEDGINKFLSCRVKDVVSHLCYDKYDYLGIADILEENKKLSSYD